MNLSAKTTHAFASQTTEQTLQTENLGIGLKLSLHISQCIVYTSVIICHQPVQRCVSQSVHQHVHINLHSTLGIGFSVSECTRLLLHPYAADFGRTMLNCTLTFYFDQFTVRRIRHASKDMFIIYYWICSCSMFIEFGISHRFTGH